MDLDDIVGNVETIERLKVIARDGNMPHIIISVSSPPRFPLLYAIYPPPSWRGSRREIKGEGVMVGNAGDWQDDECDGFGACVAGGCVQGGCT